MLCKFSSRRPSPPRFLNYIKECLAEHDDIAEIIANITYDVEEVFDTILLIDPGYHQPIIGNFVDNNQTWKENMDQFITSHFDYDSGHCLSVDFSKMSPYNNEKYIINKGVYRVHARISMNTMIKLDGKDKKNQTKRENSPFGVFLHNGTGDIDDISMNREPMTVYDETINVSTAYTTSTDLGSLIGNTQCENIRIFLPLRFYMKSILVI